MKITTQSVSRRLGIEYVRKTSARLQELKATKNGQEPVITSNLNMRAHECKNTSRVKRDRQRNVVAKKKEFLRALFKLNAHVYTVRINVIFNFVLHCSRLLYDAVAQKCPFCEFLSVFFVIYLSTSSSIGNSRRIKSTVNNRKREPLPFTK